MRIQIDSSEIDQALRYLPDGVVRPAVRMALNDSGRQGNTAGKVEIRRKWNLTAAFVNERVGISAFANEQDLTLTIQATGRPIDLTHFGARWVKGNRVVTRDFGRRTSRAAKVGGVFYEAERGKPGHLPHAFIAATRAGRSDVHIGVFMREGKGRLPLIKKVLISLPSMFEQAQVFEAISRVVAAKFPERFTHHIDRAADRMSAGPP